MIAFRSAVCPEPMSRAAIDWRAEDPSFCIAAPDPRVRSVLLDLVSGIRAPTAGTITHLEEPVTALRHRGAVAVIPLAPPDASGLTGREFLALAASTRGESAHVEDRLSRFGLERLLPRRIDAMPIADLRALLLAEALTSGAVALLVVEEPTLLMSGQTMLLSALQKWPRDGRAVVSLSASVHWARSQSIRAYEFGRAGFSPLTHADGNLHPGPWARAELSVTAPESFLAQFVSLGPVHRLDASGGSLCIVARDIAALTEQIARACAQSESEVLYLNIQGRPAEERAGTEASP